ncbi:MAG: VWA domain-containing protein [Actinobacteria bacterium]|nr:VWA domain-containing protein [Actinomycetota bacterium]MBU1942182.1 VWA domain-containing protein [Actinomycetota bacterium]MBU2688053.1 VWA domain-containing protein [Actinomycetota bacterium]
MHREEIVFPFTAVVGQEPVKKALLLNAVSDQVGGVLIRGRRGTAKSTLARAVAHLLPEIEVVTDCPFGCDPADIELLCGYCAGHLATDGSLQASRSRMRMVTLPLNATEEMVVGTLDIEKALRCGEKSFEPGILARANRSILYVDEVNLLEDHIVDILLDSAAMGVNVVEREGVSFKHGARFILVGTMNPEEGDLRPQLEDRFGLCADVGGDMSAADRAEILRRNLEFARNPLEFEALWHAAQEDMRGRLLSARELYAKVSVPDAILEAIASVVHRAGADGHRADISMLHASRALCALEALDEVTLEHVAGVAELALSHRIRRGPLEPGARVDVPSLMEGVEPTTASAPGFGAEEAGSAAADHADGTEEPPARGTVFQEPSLAGETTPSGAPGRRGKAGTKDRGRYYRSASPATRRPLQASDIAMDATIRASAARGGDGSGKPEVQPEDIKVKLRRKKSGASIVFVVDASASMGARRRLEASKEAIMSLLLDAYQNRDRVGMVVFKDAAAHLVLSPTSSPSLAGRLLGELTPGGTTPLSAGLAMGLAVLERELARDPRPSGVLVLLSDGGGNITIGSSDPMKEALAIARDIKQGGIRSIVLDTAPGAAGPGDRPSPARKIADAMGGVYFPARNLNGDAILEHVTRGAQLADVR